MTLLRRFLQAALALYIAAVLVLRGGAERGAGIVVPALCFAALAAGCFLLLGRLAANPPPFGPYCRRERGKLPLKMFLCVFAGVFAVLLLGLLANYPGRVSPDTAYQWEQVLSGQYTSIHPPAHTWLIYLVTLPWRNYTFFLAAQAAAFAAACAHMAATLAAWGFRPCLAVPVSVACAVTSATRGMLLYAWKDTALSVFALYLAVCLVNIYLSGGAWLQKRGNIAALAALLALATLMRHNAFFLTLPLAGALVIAYKRRAAVACLAAAAAVLAVTQGAYRLAGVVSYGQQTFTESVGLPMTVLTGIMVNEPWALDEGARELLLKAAPEDEWRKYYRKGDYNGVKGNLPVSATLYAESSPAQVLGYAFRAALRAPAQALDEITELTRMVWDPLSAERGQRYGAPGGASPRFAPAAALYARTDAVLRLLTPSGALASIGLHLLLLTLAGYIAVQKAHGAASLALSLPPVTYSLGTMLLLCGNDYRFFHFVTVVGLPLTLALLARRKPENGQSPEALGN
ncbi:MAG: hypothetical protein LBI44_06775 [Oscillospiraceae bacterium]|jgi:hypothetical protein|nr:hypothetical protein [Oscillospiraceae bacterium]